MSKRFFYSILTYKHSLFLGEVFNVGVLFIFPDENLIEFHYPKKLNRIKGAYKQFDESLIREYLRSFEKKASKLSGKIEDNLFGYKKIITEHFIIEDASSLQFSEFRNAIYYSSASEVGSRYYQLLLGDYNSEAIKSQHRILEDDLVKKIKTNVFERNPSLRDWIKWDEERILKANHVNFKSDFYWKKDSTQYVKTVSFDLATEDGIMNKSYVLNGQLRQLEKTKYKSAHIDFVIYSPEHSNFKDVIQEAKLILKDNQLETELFHDWQLYSNQIITHINQI